MALVEEAPLRLVGKRVKRADSPERLTGQLRYTGDLILPGLLHALQPDSPVVRERGGADQEELGMHGAAAGGSEAEQPQAPNVASHQRYTRGDVEQAFRDADVVVEREYRTPWVHQSYVEPQVCAATVDPLGNVVVYACTQALFRTRDTVAAVLGKSTTQVRVYAMPVGGAFGGKFGLIEPLVAACAVAAGRPVRLAFTRIEDFSASNPAPSSIFRVTAGARKDGTFTAIKGEV